MLIVIWMAGCAGCNPPPIPSGMTPTEGPETGGTSVRITGDKFDLKNGVTVKFDGKNVPAMVPDATSLTFRTQQDKLVSLPRCLFSTIGKKRRLSPWERSSLLTRLRQE